MSNLKQIRSEYGMGQHDLSVLLGISRGMLSMVESKKRQLPTAALLKLVEIQKALENGAMLQPNMPQAQNETRRELKTLLRACIIKERKARIDLARLEKRQRAEHIKACCCDASMQRAHLLSSPRKKETSDSTSRCRLEIKVAALQAERKIIEQRIAALGEGSGLKPV